MPAKSKFFIWATLMVVLFFGVFVPSQSNVVAQVNLEPFYIATKKPSDLRPYWSNDSRFFVFSDGFSFGTQAPYEAWYQYDIETREITTMNHWPLQADLSTQQLAAFEVGQQNGVVSAILASPNGRYVVYGSYHPSDWLISDASRALGIADLETGQHQVFDIPISPFSVFDCSTYTFYSCIKWSDDSSGFMVSSLDSSAGVISVYYFGGFKNALSETQYIDISASSFVVKPDRSVEINLQPESGKSVLYTGNFLDIVDGNRVLIEMDGQYPLLLWNPSGSTESRAIDTPDRDIRNGAFFPNDTDRILYICTRGLIEYNLITGESSVIYSDIQRGYTYFSPNGRFLVNTIHDEEKDTWAFYMVDLAEYGVQ